jgi:hypothetical protein
LGAASDHILPVGVQRGARLAFAQNERVNSWTSRNRILRFQPVARDFEGHAMPPSVPESLRAHSETVLRRFYHFHLETGAGPLLNPFPLERSRRGGRAHAHHNPMEPYRNERSGLFRPRLASRIP